MAKYHKTDKMCKSCKWFWTDGIKGGKYDRWCAEYGKPAHKAIGECKNNNKKQKHG